MLFTSTPASLRASKLRASVDPLRRIKVPRDLAPITTISDRETDPAAVGMTAAGVERIWTAARHLYRSGVYPALGLCVRRNGEVVLDRSVGWARGVGPGETRDAERIAATPDTPYCIFSASKAITATLVHLLDERGLLDIHARVAEYLPEFATKQFDEITIEHVLSHRSGFPIIPRSLMDLDKFGDPAYLRSTLSNVRVRTRPGAVQAYHAVSGGFVLGEVVREVTGKDIRAVLAEQILDPLGFRWTNYGAPPEDQHLIAHDYATGPRLLPPASKLLSQALGMSIEELVITARDPRFLGGIVPAGNVISTANELSRFMDLLRRGGTMDGVSVLQKRTVRRAVVERSFHEIDRTLGLPIRFSSGYMLGAKLIGLYGPDTDEAFGHLGFTNVMGWADPRRELSVALMTNGNPTIGPHVPALWNLTRHIGAAAPKVADPELFS
jgi:CubicO group peptidase (beta-lactamase class C family)